MDIDLLEKTELRIDGITTSGTNLTDLAATVASVLDLPSDKVLVIDVRPPQVAFDILQRTIRAESFFGKKTALLRAMAAMPGVVLAPDADIHSEGILCAIGLDEAHVADALASSRAMGEVIANSRRARVRIFPTGFELQQGCIEDTNTPYLVKIFEQAGFVAEAAAPVADNLDDLAGILALTAGDCGLAVTTGGVGAEDKDFSVEALASLDATASTPYLVRFGHRGGRHLKDGVRIGVGEHNGCRLVALPGPHDEVRLAGPVLVQGYKDGWTKQEMANRLAEILRAKFRAAGTADRPRHDPGHAHEGDPR